MKTKFYHIEAQQIAEELIKKLSSHCLRIEIAGSLRRLKPEIGDIELVARPKPRYDLFGNILSDDHDLNYFDYAAIGKPIKNGNKYKQILLWEEINLDLFIVTPPAQWGVIFLIRTGSAEFSHRFVTPRNQGGLLPSNFKVQDGAVWSNNHIIETPEEKDFFALAGVPFIEPEQRICHLPNSLI